MASLISRVITIVLLVSTTLLSGQTRVIIYDGYTGILNTYIQNDTTSIATLIPGSPAEKAGIRPQDQIIAINDSVITGIAMSRTCYSTGQVNRSIF